MEVALIETRNPCFESVRDQKAFKLSRRGKVQRIAIGDSKHFGGEKLLELRDLCLELWGRVDFLHDQDAIRGKSINALS